MIVLKNTEVLNKHLAIIKKTNETIGFVPTMGALHYGHISLVEKSKKENATTICSIFVNPTQFNDPKDYEKYPITIEKDIDMLEKAGCDVLFLPTVDEIYPNGIQNTLHYDLGFVETVLDGKYRPGHFQGVCKVVHRLLDIVTPTNMYLGQKDFQQCMVIKKLTEIINCPTHIIICPTLREADGLAMSSRNMRLNVEEREKAVRISEVLSFIKKEVKPGYLVDLKQRCINYLTAEGFKVDYVEIANANNLELLENWDGKLPLVALVAAFLNEVRLIDNMMLNCE
ncbi:MAG: pantoate--beta-alanine ligase [Ferruginibacter sp.]|nr:pantoate--beta-alanine ligase [Ferruginibacter sp.]